MKLSLNPTKSIGKVVFIVEGQRREFTFLEYLLTKVFDYTVVEYRRGKEPIVYYQSPSDLHSQIFIVNTENSNISSIKRGTDYLNAVFNELYEKYKLDLHNAATYYIFDRDPKSNNNPELIENLTTELTNARDNDTELGGLLLLSYPSLEAYLLSALVHKEDRVPFEQGEKMKEYLTRNKLYQENIKEPNVLQAADDMLAELYSLSGIEFEIGMLDDFGEYNLSIFKSEEHEFETNKAYSILSCLSCALIDLGIIVMDE